MNDALMASRAGSSSASEYLTPDPPNTNEHLALHKSLKKTVREAVHGT
jgi:hypothetical protein